MAGKSLKDSALSAEGVLILGIQRQDGSYRGAPRADEIINAGDTLVLYSKQKRVEELDNRIKGFHGEIAHREAVEAFKEDQLEDEAENIARHSDPTEPSNSPTKE